MKAQLIMLPNPIVVGDEEIKKGDWFYYYSHGKFGLYMCEGVVGKSLVIQNKESSCWSDYSKKLIAGIEGLPTVNLSLVADGIGYIDIEKLAQENSESEYPFEDYRGKKFGINDEGTGQALRGANLVGFEKGFKTHQSLNEKKYTNEHMLVIRNKIVSMLPVGEITAFDMIKSVKDFTNWFDEYVESIHKPKVYDVSIIKVNNIVTITEIIKP